MPLLAQKALNLGPFWPFLATLSQIYVLSGAPKLTNIRYEHTILSYYDCLGHKELGNIAHEGQRGSIEFEQDGRDHTPSSYTHIGGFDSF